MAYWVWQQLKFINICICTVVVIVFFVSLSLFWKKNRIVKVLRVITNIVIEVIITHIYIAIFWNRGLFLRRLWWFCSAPPTSPGPHELVRDFLPTHSELNIAHMCLCPSILARSLIEWSLITWSLAVNSTFQQSSIRSRRERSKRRQVLR